MISLWDSNRSDWLTGTTINSDNRNLQYRIDGIDIYKIGFGMVEKIKMFVPAMSYYLSMKSSIAKISNIFLTKIEDLEFNPDLVHNVRIGREPLSYASYEFAKKKDIPFFFTPIHHPKWERWPYNEYIKLYRLADFIFALTKKEKEILINLGLKEDKIIITGIGPILSLKPIKDNFKKKYNINGHMVLFLGQHFEYKGYKQLLEASKYVWREIPETYFVFIGPKYKKSKKFFDLYKHDKRIISLGFVDLEEKTNALAACDIFCLPSSQESFGGVYTEAWSFKKPVIGCDIPAVSEVIDDKENGFLTSQNGKEISKYIIDLLADDNLRATFGESGYHKVQNKYSWATISKITEDAFNNIL